MSWDVYVQDIPTGATGPADIPDDFEPRPLGLDRQAIFNAALAVGGQVDAGDPAWASWTGPGYDIELSIPAEPVNSFALHCRGDFDACRSSAHALVEQLGVRAFSMLDEGAVIG